MNSNGCDNFQYECDVAKMFPRCRHDASLKETEILLAAMHSCVTPGLGQGAARLSRQKYPKFHICLIYRNSLLESQVRGELSRMGKMEQCFARQIVGCSA